MPKKGVGLICWPNCHQKRKISVFFESRSLQTTVYINTYIHMHIFINTTRRQAASDDSPTSTDHTSKSSITSGDSISSPGVSNPKSSKYRNAPTPSLPLLPQSAWKKLKKKIFLKLQKKFIKKHPLSVFLRGVPERSTLEWNGCTTRPVSQSLWRQSPPPPTPLRPTSTCTGSRR